ncbi:MAG: protease modulator HflC [Victivallales bacterium]|nr:protease modulator HflC [bacterium]MDD7750756.1 protease modulator HflC [bacterium]MDY5695324.1 protease modulator HflC [Victivallales bacterium]
MADTHHKEHGINIPIMLLGLVVVAIFGIAIFSYQVNETERAVVLTFNKITGERGPGLHFRWPLPIQKIQKYDIRLRCFDGNIGKLEEIRTADGKNITAGIYTVYRIQDLVRFQTSGGNINAAEDDLSSQMRTVKSAVIGKYNLDRLVNSDPEKIMIPQMEKEMLELIAPKAKDLYGLEVIAVNIKTIGVPETPAKAIAERMIQERDAAAAKYKEEGNVKSRRIMTEADAAKRNALTQAEAKATALRAEGDAAAAKHLAVFAENPELAVFLRKLDSMKRLMGSRTTLVLDTNSAPFDILKFGGSALEKPAKKN